MKVPVTVGIHFMHLGKIWGLVERQIPFLMDETAQIEWKEFPAELVLAKTDFCDSAGYGTDPGYGNIQGSIFYIAKTKP